MFKPKNESKILIKKQNNTLDYKHEEYTKNILLKEQSIPKIESEIEKYKQYKKNTTDITKKLEYTDKIKTLKNNLKLIKNAHKKYL